MRSPRSLSRIDPRLPFESLSRSEPVVRPFLDLGPDPAAHSGSARLRFLRPRPQGARPHPQGSHRLVHHLRGSGHPLRGRGDCLRWRRDGHPVFQRLAAGEGTERRQPVRLPGDHGVIRRTQAGSAEGVAVRDRLRAAYEIGVHRARQGDAGGVELDLLHLRSGPDGHGREDVGPGGRGVRRRRQLRHPHREEVPAHHRPLRRRQTVHHRERPQGADPDAAGDDRHRRHRSAVRAGLRSWCSRRRRSR